MAATYIWPSEDGWPYPDDAVPDSEVSPSLEDDVDGDIVLLRSRAPRIFDDLTDLERRIVAAHYGLDGEPPRSIKVLHVELGLTRAEVRDSLVSGLEKLRKTLGSSR